MSRTFWGTVFVWIIGCALIWFTTNLGAWYSAFIVGALLSLWYEKVVLSIILGSLCAIAGWGFNLGWQALHVPIGAAASTVTGIMGLGHSGAISVLLMLVVAFLQGLVGAWLGTAIRQIAVALA